MEQELAGPIVPALQGAVGSSLGIGPGLGSVQVCDDGNPMGEAVGGVPASAEFSSVEALQDFACRFDVRLNNDEACAVDQFDLPRAGLPGRRHLRLRFGLARLHPPPSRAVRL